MRYLPVLIIAFLAPLLHGCLPIVAAGAGGAVAAGEDRRTLGTITEDQGIEFKVSGRVGDKFKDAHLNATSYNRMVLLTGEAPSEAARTEIERIARAVENVRGVYNEIALAGNSSLASRTNDSYLTGKVKARLVDSKLVNSLQIKVVTEAGTVYLLGLVKRSEADAAAELASTTGGVRKVVKLFEYLD
jgi:osmotically-inducible protein OsmY